MNTTATDFLIDLVRLFMFLGGIGFLIVFVLTGYSILKWVSSKILSVFRLVVEDDEVVIVTNRIGAVTTTVFFEGTYFRFWFLYNVFTLDSPLSYNVSATITTSEGLTAKRQISAEITVLNTTATTQTIEFLKGTQVENTLREILKDESKSVGIINVCTTTTPSDEKREKLSTLLGAYGLSLSSLEFGTIRVEPNMRQL